MKICPTCRCGSSGAPLACSGCGGDLGGVPEVGGNELAGMVIGGKYELTSLIGEGAMGWVYRGIHRTLESSIAIKLMKPPSNEDDTRDQRFEREARAASRLNNPHVISIIDFGRTPGGLLYIVSELLQGCSLGDVIAQSGAQSLERTVDVMDQVLSAIEEAHGNGLVHRDLKPDNIFVSPLRSGEDFVKVLDFGIAKLAEMGDRRLTQHGQLVGTPAYMAPEQIRGQEASTRSDLYACGMILFEMLTGKEAFPYASVMDVLAAQLSEQPPAPSQVAPEADIPAALEAVVMRCLEKDPAARFASAHELCKAIHRAAGFRRGFGAVATKSASCPECGRPVTEGARFCDQCGSTMAAPVASPIAAMPEGAQEAHARTPFEPPGPEVEWAQTPGDPSEWLGPSVTPSDSSVPRIRDLAERAATVHVATRDGLGGQGPALCRPSTASERYLIAHSTLNRRLRTEQTLRFELVGREPELGMLGQVLAEGGLAEIIGPLGSGRTRLLDAVAEQAHRDGITVLRAHADPGLHRAPWYPVQCLVAAALGLEPETRDGDAIRLQAEAQGLLSEDMLGLRILFNLSSQEGPLELAVRRRETRSAALRALCSSEVARAGLSILLDDADEYDAVSRAFLGSLVEQPAPGRRSVFLTCEKSVLPAEVARTRVEPAPLDPGEVEQVLGQAVALTTSTGPMLLDKITRASAGNPLHVTLAARLLVEGGTEVEASLPDLLQTRISRLPGDALRLLQQICILGDEVPRDLVGALYGDEEMMDRALRLLHRRGIVETVRGVLLRVTHSSLAATVREIMPVDARRDLHVRALAVLAEKGMDPIALARHALEAHVGRQALEVLHAAGRRAEQRMDDAAAADLYRRALHLARWELLIDEGDETCLLLALRLGDALCFAGELSSAEMVLKEAAGSAGHHPGILAQLQRSLGRVLVRHGRPQEGMELFTQALRLSLIAGDRALLTEIYTNVGKVLADLGRTAEAAREMLEGVDLVTAGEGATTQEVPFGFWRLLLQLGEAQMLLEQSQGAMQHAAAALDHARREGSLIGEARSHFLLSKILDRRHHRDTGQRHHVAAVRTFRRMGDRQSQAECLLDRAARVPGFEDENLQEALNLAHQVAWAEGVSEASRLLASR